MERFTAGGGAMEGATENHMQVLTKFPIGLSGLYVNFSFDLSVTYRRSPLTGTQMEQGSLV